MNEPSNEKQRLDKWIWHARFVKSRSLAQKLITGGNIRINSEKVTSASRQLKTGDTLTIAIQDQVRVIRVDAISNRRGPFSEAQLLYEDLSPVVKTKKAKEPSLEEMPKIESSGRPTKQQRRQIMQMKRNSTE